MPIDDRSPYSSDDEVLIGLSGSDSSSEYEVSIFASDVSDDSDLVLLHHDTDVNVSALRTVNSAIVGLHSNLTSALSNLSLASNAPGNRSESESSKQAPKDAAAEKRKKKKAKQRARRQRKAARAHKEQAKASKSPAPASGASPSLNITYDEASEFVTSSLHDPKSVDKLAFLQALIVELDVKESDSPEFPKSLTQAKKLLKEDAHINIREYYAARGKTQAEIVKLKHPSHSSLRKSIRKKKNPAPRGWVKEKGLQSLLVVCF
ncbi:hypothetical protein CONPUDRAFT_141758 [Coniophora puteana RWD-64-598 SS2]|uniref:Uncharacterized protein n=1 Tax=Coniophora puteana (strain RWD-64-598) TaxID=741705 RepID=A0A5M3N255_CONPW|nr:uncharacterized protein CONPUDRAFT_141758 [Coniophora puteana RWD-64-598 SS2]EIW84971.1 hypothetical protein CONPUDRAFT_141758 [Coniophora puteana RWD-64-598 SS2]